MFKGVKKFLNKIKLFVIFVVLKVFFFPNFLKQHAEKGHEADYVSEQLTTLDNQQ